MDPKKPDQVDTDTIEDPDNVLEEEVIQHDVLHEPFPVDSGESGGQ